MDFEIAGQTYRSRPMPTRTQLHVSRRLAPFLASTLSGIQGATTGGQVDFAQSVSAIAEALSQISDADCDFILDSTLGLVSRQQSDVNWAPIFNAKAKSMQFDDISLSVMLQITAQVVQQELGPFLQEIAGFLNPQEPSPGT